MRLSANDLNLLRQCAIGAAYQAGHIIESHAGRPVAVGNKTGGASLAAQVVTEVDHLSQQAILQALQPACEMFDLAVLSEEQADDGSRLRKDYFWCIDPLDGTLPFIEGVAGYSVSIALVDRAGSAIIGVVYDPLARNLYSAVQNGGAWRDGQRLALPITASRGNILKFITDKSFAVDPLYQAAEAGLERLALGLGYAGAALVLQGGAAMNACQVLADAPACYFKFPKPQAGGGSVWDYAATACLFREAGAIACDMFGNDLELNPQGALFMNRCGVLYCADSELASAVVELYRQLQSRC
ncbi:3'(2'),5'-bisphosphate nucleotidase CysQ [Methylomonas sp. DH-1]|uniref:3'(2'),5'-bisphosphate nucleotidase CysQ family protein n=1 Tax=Methylomonas sp. (strain DH-1) TaxID=1727196 RepID=UPI0007C937AF|nr:inositol monophosphatase family protein [Methylomonas sp. DH-1]ANE53956.1 inositol-phosphate phosphatase [Methylomonas sp. DH-1]